MIYNIYIKVFLRILRKHFPPSSDLYKLFNSKKVKLSYSCCPSMKNIISSHNAKITREKEMVAARSCNCRGGVVSCPLGGKCLTACLVYKLPSPRQGGRRAILVRLPLPLNSDIIIIRVHSLMMQLNTVQPSALMLVPSGGMKQTTTSNGLLRALLHPTEEGEDPVCFVWLRKHSLPGVTEESHWTEEPK